MLVNVALVLPVEILRDSVLGLDVVDKIGAELEVLVADLASENTPVQPLNLFRLETTHQLFLVVVQRHLVALRDVLVEGEVVTEDAEKERKNLKLYNWARFSFVLSLTIAYVINLSSSQS